MSLRRSLRAAGALSVVALAGALHAAPAHKQLFSEGASASSYLENNWNRFSENYHPSYLLDGDPATAWVEGAEGDGHGEHASWRLSSLPRASEVKLRIRNGYQKSRKLFDANAVPREVAIALLGPRGIVVEKRATLEKKLGWQELLVEVPGNAAIEGVRLTVLSTYPGRVYKDSCISDVETWVRSDVAYNEKAEQAKRARLLAWVKGRRDEAAYFKQLPPEYPFAGTHFTHTTLLSLDEPRALDAYEENPKPVAGWRPADQRVLGDDLPSAALPHLGGQVLLDMKLIHELAKGEGAALGKSWHKVELSRRLKLPDGLELPWPYRTFVPSFQDLLDPSAFGVAETKRQSAGRSRGYVDDEGGTLRKWEATHARVKRGASGKLAALYFEEHHVIEERSVYQTRARHLLVFDDEQRPSAVVSLLDGDDGVSFYRLAFVRDQAGRIERVEYRKAALTKTEELGEIGDGNHWLAVDFTAAARVANK